MTEHEDIPLSERLTGIENANRFVLDNLRQEEKSIPGFFRTCYALRYMELYSGRHLGIGLPQ